MDMCLVGMTLHFRSQDHLKSSGGGCWGFQKNQNRDNALLCAPSHSNWLFLWGAFLYCHWLQQCCYQLLRLAVRREALQGTPWVFKRQLIMPLPLYDNNKWALSASQIPLLLPDTATLTVSNASILFFLVWYVQKKKKLLIGLYDNRCFPSFYILLVEEDNELFPSRAVIYFCLYSTPRVLLLCSSHAWFSWLGTRTLVAPKSWSQISSDCKNSVKQLQLNLMILVSHKVTSLSLFTLLSAYMQQKWNGRNEDQGAVVAGTIPKLPFSLSYLYCETGLHWQTMLCLKSWGTEEAECY